MKSIVILITFYLFVNDAYGQSLITIFKHLPLDCTPELSKKQKDTLLLQGEYILPGGDSIETVKYTIDTTLIKKGYLSYEYNFTTGQNGFIAFELRRFRRANGTLIFVYSRYGGMLRAFEQQDVIIYELKNGKLVINNDGLLPSEIPIKDFFIKDTPKDIIAYASKYVNQSYSLYPDNSSSISYTIDPQFPNEEENKKYILGYTIVFTWNGNRFIKKLQKG